jgi:hypothetical protein
MFEGDPCAFELHPPLASEVDLLDAPGLGFCPGLHSHSLDQAEVENLDVVRQTACLVGIWVEEIAGEI